MSAFPMANQFIFLLLLCLTLSNVIALTSNVDPSIFETLKTRQTVTLILSMREKTLTHQQVLDHSSRLSFDTRKAKLNTITDALKAYSAEIQNDVLSFLATQNKTEVTPLWITGQIIVRSADESLVKLLTQRSDIEKIDLDREHPLPTNMEVSAPFKIHSYTQSTAEWGVEAVQAPQVWKSGNNGQGIVVGVIDTGVRMTHEALRSTWRKDFGWYDPEHKKPEPYDAHGHGSHTTGTIAGTTKGIGVAPGAQWVHCKGCGDRSCSQSHLLECGQWMSCPKDDSGKEDCSKAPMIVSNSWGGIGGSDSYEKVISAWRAKGIIPIFAAGNNGPFCLTIGSPADSPNVIAVGSTMKGDKMSRFSSSGPGYKRFLIKPDVSAPGSDVISAGKSSDTEYVKMSGTSMACPHAAGVAALMLSQNKTMTYDDLKSNLSKSCEPVTPAVLYFFCGGSRGGKKFPNHNAGFGRINAAKATNVSN